MEMIMPVSFNVILAIVGTGLLSLVGLNLMAIPVTPLPVTTFEVSAMTVMFIVGVGLLKYAIPRVRKERMSLQG